MKSFFLKSCVAVSFSASSLLAHFGVVIPSANVVEEQAKLQITYKFTHPFEQMMMNMVKPNEAGVFINGKKTDLLPSLKEQKDGQNSYQHRAHKGELAGQSRLLAPQARPSHHHSHRHLPRFL